jgi:hypothetical protein
LIGQEGFCAGLAVVFYVLGRGVGKWDSGTLSEGTSIHDSIKNDSENSHFAPFEDN